MSYLDKYFLEEQLKNATEEEKQELKQLEIDSDKLWDEYLKIYKEKEKFRIKLKPIPSKLKEELTAKKEKDLFIISTQIRELKEKRNEINRKFREDTKGIRIERKKQLNSNPTYMEIKQRLSNADKIRQEAQNKLHNRWSELTNKYKAGIKA